MTANNSLAAALVAAQAAMPKVEPDAVNPHFKNKFVSLDHLIAKTRPVLNANGLAILQFPSSLDGQPALTTMLVHTSGEQLEGTVPLILAKQDMQGLGGAITYARRYGWASVLGIASEEDDDGEAASRPARKPQERSGAAADVKATTDVPLDGKRPPEAADTFAVWAALMKELGVPEPNGWLARAVQAFYGSESMKDLTEKQRKEALAQANTAYVLLYDDGGTLEPLGVVTDARLIDAFSSAFGGIKL